MTLILEVKVVTCSGKSQLILDKLGQLKCFIKAAPEKGKANKEVIDIVSKAFQVQKRAIEITSGLTSRKKLLKIKTDMTYKQLLDELGFGVQQKII